jgi:hypothetical protein
VPLTRKEVMPLLFRRSHVYGLQIRRMARCDRSHRYSTVLFMLCWACGSIGSKGGRHGVLLGANLGVKGASKPGGADTGGGAVAVVGAATGTDDC